VPFYFLIITFSFKIVIFAHFFVDLQPMRPKFEKTTTKVICRHLELLILLYSENDVSGIFIEKALYQNVEKTGVF
jgi:hypothetical protein